MFKDTTQSLLNYVRSFGKYYDLGAVDVRITHFVRGLMSSTFLATNTRDAYISFIGFVKIMIEHQGVLSFLVMFGKRSSIKDSCHYAPRIPLSLHLA